MTGNRWLERIEQFGGFEYELAGNTPLRWLLAAVVAVLALFALKLLIRFVISRLQKITAGTATRWDDGLTLTLEATRNLFLVVLALYFGSLVLELPVRAREIMQSVAIVALLIQAAFWGNVLLDFTLERQLKRKMETDAAAATSISAMSFVGRLILWSLVTLLALDNMGIDVTALMTGLGIGGIAVALAAQNILGDLFASISIVLDKPFVLGDFITVGEYMGSVEKIGLKTTRLRSLSGEQLIFSNADLLASRIRNFKRMSERRMVFKVGVTYETPREKLAALPGLIREIVESSGPVRFDRAHFQGFGKSSLDFETVYYVTVPDYNVSMDVQQAINLALLERFSWEGIEFAYAAPTILVANPQPETSSAA
jgi:small-conductance mechanosensitive channel